MWEILPIFSIKSIFLHFRQQIFAAFTEEFLAAPFTDQIFHFIIPALADVQTIFPYEVFLNALLVAESGCSRSDQAPWLFYFVLTVGETYLGEKAKWPIHCFFIFELICYVFPQCGSLPSKKDSLWIKVLERAVLLAVLTLVSKKYT